MNNGFKAVDVDWNLKACLLPTITEMKHQRWRQFYNENCLKESYWWVHAYNYVN